ncbi:Pyruvate decarboxylase [Abortiporus biennis]
MTTTTATIFFKTLSQAGFTHAFVNWGNDHPALLEELERQRIEGGNGQTTLQIVTCPNEMVALSAAQGYAQVIGKPALVIVHVDVGTQALAGAVHNVDKGRVPVLIFAGEAPFSAYGELKGSKNEWPMWSQDVPDQAGIVRQYMRYTNQIRNGKTAGKMLLRAMQFAVSEPQGPVYLHAKREIMEEEVDQSFVDEALDSKKWPAIAPTALSETVVQTIVDSLVTAKFPLIIAANSGRNPATVATLSELSNLLSIAIYNSCPSSVCIPYSHPHFLGTSFGGKTTLLEEADVLLIIDTDVPWVDICDNAPKPGSKVFMIDPDPLKQGYSWSHIDADIICRADSQVALNQLLNAAKKISSSFDQNLIEKRSVDLKTRHDLYIEELVSVEDFSALLNGASTTSQVVGIARKAVEEFTPSHGRQTLWLNEGITNYEVVFDHVRPELPGSMICSGGTSLGWALGAAVGARLGARAFGHDTDLIVAIVGDGTFIFGVPSAAYWISRKYDTPYLTIVLNNGGWKAPKNSMLGVYPTGLGSKASGERLTTGFGPDAPDYGQIAAAAGGAWARRVEGLENIKKAIEEGIKVVLEEKRSAVVDCIVESI